jgi:hypothetical protein
LYLNRRKVSKKEKYMHRTWGEKRPLRSFAGTSPKLMLPGIFTLKLCLPWLAALRSSSNPAWEFLVLLPFVNSGFGYDFSAFWGMKAHKAEWGLEIAGQRGDNGNERLWDSSAASVWLQLGSQEIFLSQTHLFMCKEMPTMRWIGLLAAFSSRDCFWR